ncbi:SMP-30/gluconolactonase/LRE family protein [Rhodococcus phenolicus]|uniref:SMP-30/gluconolactonase/LRE family protein n=1 Tax=Rhodococcus phenolicus TaxID=263849 RepID=UPI0008327BAA|nr:SMP-30/gluconolactonase/LRE family protein [Rhodococcus phenolicus]
MRIAVGVAAATVSAMIAVPTANAGTTACAPRTVSTVTSGLGVLENLEFDGRGGLLVSGGALAGDGALRRVASDGTVGTVLDDVTGPGGIVVDGATTYLNVGNTAASGLNNTPDGTIDTIDLDTGERRTVATGIVMPNGLGVLPDGSLLTSRDIGAVGLSRAAGDGGEATVLRTDLGSVNGIEVDGDTVYTVTTFEAVNRLHVLAATDLTGPVRSIDLPGPGLLQAPDDLTLGPDGALYIALNLAGAILRVDPQTGESCRVAEGIPFVSSVAFGNGPGWDPDTIYTTGFDGTVRAAHPGTAQPADE